MGYISSPCTSFHLFCQTFAEPELLCPRDTLPVPREFPSFFARRAKTRGTAMGKVFRFGNISLHNFLVKVRFQSHYPWGWTTLLDQHD